MGKNNFFKITSTAFVLAGALSLGYYNTSEVYGGGEFASTSTELDKQIKDLQNKCQAELKDSGLEVCDSCLTSTTASLKSDQIASISKALTAVECNNIPGILAVVKLTSKSEVPAITEEVVKPKAAGEPTIKDQIVQVPQIENDIFDGHITSEKLRKEALKCEQKNDKDEFNCFKALISKYSKSPNKQYADTEELTYLRDNYLTTYAKSIMEDAKDSRSFSKAARIAREVTLISARADLDEKEVKSQLSGVTRDALVSFAEKKLDNFDPESENYATTLTEIIESRDEVKDFMEGKDVKDFKAIIAPNVIGIYQDTLKSEKMSYIETVSDYQSQNQEFGSDNWINPYEAAQSQRAMFGLTQQFNQSFYDVNQSTQVLRSMGVVDPSSLSNYYNNQYKESMARINAAVMADPFGLQFKLESLDNMATSFNLNNFQATQPFSANGNNPNGLTIGQIGQQGQFQPTQQQGFAPGQQQTNSRYFIGANNGNSGHQIGQQQQLPQQFVNNTTGISQRQIVNGNQNIQRSNNLGNYGLNTPILAPQSTNRFRGIL